MIKKYIEVNTQFTACHRWKDAPAEVHFLNNFHRHLFKLAIEIRVTESDRELEFFMILKRLNNFLDDTFKDKYLDLSCESMGEVILNEFLIKQYGSRFYSVKVSEDGENAGIIQYNP